MGGAVRGLPCVCVGDCLFVRGRVFSGESGGENRELGEEMMEEEEGRVFDSHCFGHIMMQFSAVRHVQRISRLMATRRTQTGPIPPAPL